MADEQENAALPEVADAPPIAPEEPPPPPTDYEEPQSELPEGEVEEPAEEFEEFEWNGKAIRAPKGLKDGVLMHSDYTKKTQEVAATRKELEAAKARLDQQAKASEEYIELKADHRAKTRELAAYENVDWQAWSLQDPIACQQGYIAFQNLKQEAGELSQKISEADRKRSDETQQEIAKRLHETHEYAKANIKGWNDDRAKKVIDFGLNGLGIPREDLQAAMSPKVVEALHYAEIGYQVLHKKPAPTLGAKPAPLQIVASKSSPPAAKRPEDMNMDEYKAWRARGGGTRRK
jgi:hypothetical protein